MRCSRWPGAVIVASAVMVAACTTDPSPTTLPDDPGASAASVAPSDAATTVPPTDPATEKPTQPPPPRRVTVAMSGDVLLHSGLWATARMDAERTGRGRMDFRPLLAPMRSLVRGVDLAICHLETPVARRGGPYSSYPVFSVPPQIIPALGWVGFDVCTTASNHSVDQGFTGLRHTLQVLDRHRIEHAGTARTRREARRPVLLDAGEVTVGLVSQTYGTNGIPLPDGHPWSVDLLDVPKALRDARQAGRAGADVVLVALHWGLEYLEEPTPEQRKIARRLLRSPHVDLVYGHHAHVVQPFDQVRQKWVAYGLGNMVAQQLTEITGVYDGVTAVFSFAERADGDFEVVRARFVPTYISGFDPARPAMRWLRTTEALAEGTSYASNAELRAALSRVRRTVNLLDAREHGLRMLRERD